MELLKPQTALLALGLWACVDAPPESASAVLARVGEAEISERDFAAALEKLPAGSEAQPLADWRRQFQALIDKELLLLEARAQGLDEAVAGAVAAWERKELVEQLLVREMGEQLAYAETELAEFFAESGAGREIRLRRLPVRERAAAMEMLKKAQDGVDLPGEWGESGWLNALNAGDARMAALFLREVGAVELVETNGQYWVIAIAAEREVSLADRRPLVEAALTRHKKQQANLAYLEQLTNQYAVQLDTAALRQVAEGAAQTGGAVGPQCHRRLEHGGLPAGPRAARGKRRAAASRCQCPRIQGDAGLCRRPDSAAGGAQARSVRRVGAAPRKGA